VCGPTRCGSEFARGRIEFGIVLQIWHTGATRAPYFCRKRNLWVCDLGVQFWHPTAFEALSVIINETLSATLAPGAAYGRFAGFFAGVHVF
jgi:hypothetical protein